MNRFVAPHPLQTCVEILQSRQRMPQRQSFGMWVDDRDTAPGVDRTLRCTLVSGRAGLQRIAAVEVELAARADRDTDVLLKSAGFNAMAGARFLALGVLGALVMLVTDASPTAKIIFLVVFSGLAVFGILYNRALHSMSQRLPELIREWLNGQPPA